MQAIKNTYRFIKWQISQFTFFGFNAFVSVFSACLSLAFVNTAAYWGFAFLSVSALVVMFSMLLYRTTKAQYERYKEDRQNLFNTIKHSDK